MIIKAVAETIESSCGSMDVCGRIGGDEFVVVGRGDNFAHFFEERFNEEIERRNRESDKPYMLSASIGYVSTVPEEEDSLLEFIQRADAEMYVVKRAKKKAR